MTVEDSVEVQVSEENGNVPAMVDADPTPSPDPTPATDPVVTPDPAATAAPTEELFELPDGRKVDAATLSKEWKENFYPDYTKKAQALAAKEKPLETPTPSKYADPNYVPQSYEEVLEEATNRALQKMEMKESERLAGQKAIEDAVETQLTDIRKTDPKLNENALFQHATKYGFRDLKAAYQNMTDMQAAIKKTQTTTAANIAKRNDPVSANPGATGGRPDPSQFASARDYLKSLQ